MLQLYYGRAGSGKTEKLLEAVRTQPVGTSMLFLTPETASHMTERRVADTLGDRASLLCEVVTFRRLSHQIFASAGGLAVQPPDDGARILLMYGAFERMRRTARVYTRLPRSCSTIQSFLAFYDECAAGCAGPERLAQLSASCPGLLGDKLRDFAALFAFYEEAVQNALADPRDALDRAADQAQKSGFFRDKVVLIDGFEGFTPLERRLLDVILAQARDVYAAFTGDALAPDDDSVFAKPMRTAARLIQAAESHGHKVRAALCDALPDRPGDLAFLEARLEDYGTPSYTGDCPAVRLYTAASLPSECEAAAAALRTAVRREGLRWRDCAIVTPDVTGYAQTLTAVLSRMEIPYFLSEKTDLLATPVCALAVSALDAAAGGMETEDVLACLKTGLLAIPPADVDALENYTQRRRIRSFSPDAPWTGHPDGLTGVFDDASRARLAHLNEIRKAVRGPLAALRDGIAGTSAAEDKARALYDFLERVELPAVCLTRSAEAADPAEADLYRQLWDVLCRALDSFADALGTRPIDARTFVSLFRLALSQYSVGVIPSSLDRVHVGSLESLAARRARAVFVLGMTDAWPGGGEAGGVLSDSERDALDLLGLELSDTADLRDSAARFAFYETVAKPDLLLRLSFPADGDTRESSVLTRIRELLPGVPCETEPPEGSDAALAAPATAAEAALESRTPAQEAMRRWMEAHPAHAARLAVLRDGAALPRGPVQSAPLRRALYGARPRLSATGVDLFFSCRYRYFARSGLRLDEPRPADFDAPEIGSFLHYVLEHTARDVRENYPSWRDAPKEEVIALGRRWSEQYASEVLSLPRQSARLRFLFSRVRDSLDQLLSDLCDEFSVCLFEPWDFELHFSAHDTLGSVEIPLPGGGKAVLSGQVDRVDGFYRDGTLYARVVDYKSAARAFSFADIRAGLDLQLLVYLFVLQERAARYRLLHPELPPGTVIVPAGVLYAPIGAPVVTLAASPDEDPREAADTIAKRNKRTGLLTDDEAVLRAMEPDGKGLRIPVTFTGSGALSANASVASPAQFAALERHVRRLLTEMGQSLARGDTDAVPLIPQSSGRLTCETCPYHAVCRFDPEIEPVREAGSLSRADFFESLEEGGSGNESAPVE